MDTSRNHPWLAVFIPIVLVNTVLLNLVFRYVIPTEDFGTTLGYVVSLVTFDVGTDSSYPMGLALDYFRTTYRADPDADPIYTHLFFGERIKFIYPPMSLFFQGGVERLTGWFGTGFMPVLNWVFVLVTAAANAAIYFAARSGTAARKDSRLFDWMAATAIVAATLVYYPVAKSYALGQVQVWINMAFALAVLALLRGRPAAAGALVAAMALLKPHYGLLLLWGVLRRDWRFTGMAAAVLAVAGLASLWVFGWENHVDYLRVVSYIGARGEAYYSNHSLNGLLNRWMSLTDPVAYNNLVWRGDHFPPPTEWIASATTAFSVAVVGLACLASVILRRSPEAEVFVLFAISLTLASPIAWEHHWGILGSVLVLLLASRQHQPLTLLCLLVAYLLTTNRLPVLYRLAETPFNPLQSHMFLAALVLLATLLLTRPDPTGPVRSA